MRTLMIVFSLVLIAGTRGQDPAPSTTLASPRPDATVDADPALLDGIARACGTWREADGLAGGGPDYRIQFDRVGATFTPALPSASRTHHLRLQMISVGREHGSAAIANDAEPTADGDRCVQFTRAPGVVERYELSAAGVEHEIRLADRPSGTGDLVARIALSSSLVASTTGPCTDGLPFRGAAGMGVDIGSPVAIDAAGRRLPMTMAFDGQELELRLDAAFVDDAVYPLLLDPPIATVFPLSANSGHLEPDVVWNERAGRYLVAWSVRLSAVSAEVRGVSLDSAGAFRTSLFRIDSGGDLSTAPTVAHIPRAGSFVVAWQEATSPFGPWDVFARAVQVDGTRSSLIQVTSDNANDMAPSLGSEATIVDDDAVLVWTRVGEGIRGVQFQVTVSTSGSPPITTLLGERLLVNDPGASGAAISRSGGLTGNYLLAWQTSSRGLGAMVVDRDLVPQSSTFAVESGVTPTDQVAVDGNGRQFAVAYRTTATSTTDVYCSALLWNGSSLARTAGPTAIANDPTRDERTPNIAWLGSKFLLGWTVEGPGFLNYDLHLRTFATNCEPCGDLHVARRSTTAYDTDPVIGSQFAGGGRGKEAIVVFSSVDNSSLATSIHAQRFEAFGAGGSVVSLSGGCSGGGTASTSGAVAVGNPDFRYRLDGADPAATFALFYLGLPDQTFTCGSCSYIVPIISVPVPISGGTAQVRSPVSCLLYSAIGASLDVQWITIGTSGAPCATFPGVSASNRLRVTIGL